MGAERAARLEESTSLAVAELTDRVDKFPTTRHNYSPQGRLQSSTGLAVAVSTDCVSLRPGSAAAPALVGLFSGYLSASLGY